MPDKLVSYYGKPKVNTLTKYPSILTLHELGDRGRLEDTQTTPLAGEKLYATEKIDGTNVRIVCWQGEYHLVGSRENILHFSGDLYFDPAQDIVTSLNELRVYPPQTQYLTVIYGELFGGKLSANSAWYGRGAKGFRVFDIAVFKNLDILDRPLSEISAWRETKTDKGMIYGQRFLTMSEARRQFPMFDYVPEVSFDPGDYSHEAISQGLHASVATTRVALTDAATRKAEGVVLRTEDRSKIVKVRFEDYARTLRLKI